MIAPSAFEPGRRLHQAFQDTFIGGGWADPVAWEDFDQDGRARYAAAETRYHELLSEGPSLSKLIDDELYRRAVMFATRDKASTSYIQRVLGIAYNPALAMILRMEAEGLISKSNAAGKREILVPWSPVTEASPP